MSQEAPVVDKRTVVRVGLPNRASHVPAVIKVSQPSATPTAQTFQYIKLPLSGVEMSGRGDEENSDTARRHDLISRHPPYRKLYNELGHNTSIVYKLEDDSSDGHINQDSNDASDDHGRQMGRTYQIISQDDHSDEGLQSITLKNLSAGNVTSSGGTIVQYTQGPDGQLFIPVHQLNSSGLVFPHGLVMSGGGGPCSPPIGLEESCKKRELRLLKNKEAAKECRRKKKEYVKCLENRVAVLENQNKTLIEELKSLKELYCQKDIHS